jgi:peptide/nickel transport system substrate-binding protein
MTSNNSKNFRSVVVTSTVLILFLTSACSRKQSAVNETVNYTNIAEVDTAGAVSGDWIIQRELADPQSLNPITLQDATGREYSLHIFERLMWAANRENYELIPWIAESFPEISSDQLSYTFNIRKDVRFSDGKPLSGKDLIFTFKAAMNPLVDAAQLRQSIDMLNKVELVNGDEYRVRFIFSRPYFKAVYAICDIQIMAKHTADPEGLTDKYTFEECRDIESARKNQAMKKFADWFNSQEMNRNPQNLIGSGPYIFEKWETGQWVYFRRNPDYWNKNGAYGRAFPDKLVIRVIQDQSSATVAAKNREIDLMYVTKPVDFVKELANPDEFGMRKADPFEPVFNYLAYNQKNIIFSDVRVRWALAYLVDRDLIIEKVQYNLAVPTQSAVYFGDREHYNSELPEIKYNPDKARELLTEAGWTDTDGNGILDKSIDGRKTEFRFTYLLNTNEQRKQTCLVIADAMKKVGIIADIQTLEWSVFLEKLKKHEFDAYMGAWVLTDYPPDLYQLFHSSQSLNEGSNYMSFSDPAADSLMEQYRKEFDLSARIRIIKEIQKILYDRQAYTFLWVPKAKYVYGERFRNVRWYPTPITSYQATEWWVPLSQQKYKSAN